MGTFVSAYSSHSYGVSPLQELSASSAYVTVLLFDLIVILISVKK